MTSSVDSPPVTWKLLKNYSLKNLKTDFKIADFERNTSSSHIKDIVNAILSNRFYGNVISVVKSKKPWVVIDAQHRLQALWIAHVSHGVKTYDLMLAIYPEEFARMIFRRINMGKPLQTRDHSRALDDKKTPFFTELQPWLAHDRTPTKGTFPEMLHALHYAKGAKRAVQVRELDTVIDAITKSDIEMMKKFCTAIKQHSPFVFKAMAYRAAIYRNVFRIGYDKNFTVEQFFKLIEKSTRDKKIIQITQSRKHIDILNAYKVMVDEILPLIK